MADDTITTFNRQNCQALTDAINEALKPVGERFGVLIKTVGGRYSDLELKERLSILVAEDNTGDNESNNSQLDFEQARWNRECTTFGMVPDDFGRQFRCNGTVYTICGCKASRWKYPVSATGPRGGQYKFTADVVKAGLI